MNTNTGNAVACTGIKAAGKLILKLILFTLPFSSILVLYVIEDPFMVIRKYPVYDSEIVLNEGYTAWQIYRNHRDSAGFNSFIMGNSCTMAFPCAEWERHLPANSHAMRLFGNGEPMKAIQMKLEALERDGTEIRNVLMVVDKESLEGTRLYTEFLNILPSEVSCRSETDIQREFLQGFIMPDFLFPYIRYRITGKIPASSRYFNPYGRIRDSGNNDCLNPRERSIKEESESYWETRPHDFPTRDSKAVCAEKVIFGPQIELLREVAGILERNGTSFHIIISPDYNQIYLNPEDRAILEEIFGKEHVHDFSGVNEFTADYHNYYEHTHYRPLLGIKLMERIYGGTNFN